MALVQLWQYHALQITLHYREEYK